MPPTTTDFLGTTIHKFEIAIGPLPITGFGIAMLLAFLIGQFVATSELTRRGQHASAEAMGDIVVGAGNIYACEALFRAGIDPRWAQGIQREDFGAAPIEKSSAGPSDRPGGVHRSGILAVSQRRRSGVGAASERAGASKQPSRYVSSFGQEETEADKAYTRTKVEREGGRGREIAKSS